MKTSIKQMKEELAMLKSDLAKYKKYFLEDGSIDANEQEHLDTMIAIIKKCETKIAALSKSAKEKKEDPHLKDDPYIGDDDDDDESPQLPTTIEVRMKKGKGYGYVAKQINQQMSVFPDWKPIKAGMLRDRMGGQMLWHKSYTFKTEELMGSAFLDGGVTGKALKKAMQAGNAWRTGGREKYLAKVAADKAAQEAKKKAEQEAYEAEEAEKQRRYLEENELGECTEDPAVLEAAAAKAAAEKAAKEAAEKAAKEAAEKAAKEAEQAKRTKSIRVKAKGEGSSMYNANVSNLLRDPYPIRQEAIDQAESAARRSLEHEITKKKNEIKKNHIFILRGESITFKVGPVSVDTDLSINGSVGDMDITTRNIEYMYTATSTASALLYYTIVKPPFL